MALSYIDTHNTISAAEKKIIFDKIYKTVSVLYLTRNQLNSAMTTMALTISKQSNLGNFTPGCQQVLDCHTPQPLKNPSTLGC